MPFLPIASWVCWAVWAGGGRWRRRQQLQALALQLSLGLFVCLFVCFFNQTLFDFLAESRWVHVLQRSSGCSSHLKIQPKENTFAWEALNSMTKSTVLIWHVWPDPGAAAVGPCGAQRIVSAVFLFSRRRLTQEGVSCSQSLQAS